MLFPLNAATLAVALPSLALGQGVAPTNTTGTLAIYGAISGSIFGFVANQLVGQGYTYILDPTYVPAKVTLPAARCSDLRAGFNITAPTLFGPSMREENAFFSVGETAQNFKSAIASTGTRFGSLPSASTNNSAMSRSVESSIFSIDCSNRNLTALWVQTRDNTTRLQPFIQHNTVIRVFNASYAGPPIDFSSPAIYYTLNFTGSANSKSSSIRTPAVGFPAFERTITLEPIVLTFVPDNPATF